MVRKIIQPWWIRKQIALTVARLPSWGLRCCRPKEPLSEPRRGEFRRRAANRRANRTGNAACQEIVFESSWHYILHISFLNAHLLALRTRSIPRSKELGQFRLAIFSFTSNPLSQIATSNPRLQPDTPFTADMFPYKITELFQELGFKSKPPKKPGNTPLSGLYLSFLDIKTTVSTWHDRSLSI